MHKKHDTGVYRNVFILKEMHYRMNLKYHPSFPKHGEIQRDFLKNIRENGLPDQGRTRTEDSG